MGTTEAPGLEDLHQFTVFQHNTEKRKERDVGVGEAEGK